MPVQPTAPDPAVRAVTADELRDTVLALLGLPSIAGRIARGQPLVEVNLRLQFRSPADAVTVTQEVERG